MLAAHIQTCKINGSRLARRLPNKESPMSPHTVFGQAFVFLLPFAAATSIQAGPGPSTSRRPLNAFDSAVAERPGPERSEGCRAPSARRSSPTSRTAKAGRSTRNLETWGLTRGRLPRDDPVLGWVFGAALRKAIRAARDDPGLLPVYLCPGARSSTQQAGRGPGRQSGPCRVHGHPRDAPHARTGREPAQHASRSPSG